jgi:hypothetical protein
VDFERGVVVVRQSKSGRPRTVSLTAAARAALIEVRVEVETALLILRDHHAVRGPCADGAAREAIGKLEADSLPCQ